MADLSVNICGIDSPNPFWLASAPPTNTGDQISRAFDAGWGGAVWKTLGVAVENVYSRYSSVDFNGQKMMGFNNESKMDTLHDVWFTDELDDGGFRAKPLRHFKRCDEIPAG